MSTPTPAAAVSAEPVVVTPGAPRPNSATPSVGLSTSIPTTLAFVAVVSVELAVVVSAPARFAPHWVPKIN